MLTATPRGRWWSPQPFRRPRNTSLLYASGSAVQLDAGLAPRLAVRERVTIIQASTRSGDFGLPRRFQPPARRRKAKRQRSSSLLEEPLVPYGIDEAPPV